MSEDLPVANSDQQDRLPVPYYPSHQDKQDGRYQVDPDFDKTAFNEQFGPPEQRSFVAANLSNAQAAMDARRDPNLIRGPELTDEQLADQLRTLDDDLQAQARYDARGDSHTGASNAPSMHPKIGGPTTAEDVTETAAGIAAGRLASDTQTTPPLTSEEIEAKAKGKPYDPSKTPGM